MSITRTWSVVDLPALQRNYEVLKKYSEQGMRIQTLVGANAYSFEPCVGGPMQGTCPQYLAVDSIEDAAALRQDGVTLPILVAKYEKPVSTTAYVKKLHYNFLSQSVSSIEETRALSSRTIPAYGGVIGVHIKVEIAESGSGFHYVSGQENIDDLISAKSRLGMYCEGIYTVLHRSEPEEIKAAKVKALHELADRLTEKTMKPFAIRHVVMDD